METTTLLRRALLVIAAFSVVGTAIELAMLRHWETGIQLIPWAAVLVLALAIVLAARGLSRRMIIGVRCIGTVVAATSIFGVVEHVLGNYSAGPLNARFASTWATMSEPARIWAAFTKTVGPSPSLVPLVLAQAALCVVFATLGWKTTDGEHTDATAPDPERERNTA